MCTGVDVDVGELYPTRIKQEEEAVERESTTTYTHRVHIYIHRPKEKYSWQKQNPTHFCSLKEATTNLVGNGTQNLAMNTRSLPPPSKSQNPRKARASTQIRFLGTKRGKKGG